MIAIGNVKFEINSPEDLALRKKLLDNASIILTTLRGTNPLNRAMGLIPGDIVGRTVILAKAAYSVQAIEQIEKYEPRLKITRIAFEAGISNLIPKVVLTYNVN
jgi:phage baseplate assembly protein W